MGVSFDLFDTLVSRDRPAEPWEPVAAELDARGVAIPADWEAAYRESHADIERGAEQSLVAHVRAALTSRGVETAERTIHKALLAAFDGREARRGPDRLVSVREGAPEAVEAASEAGPVGILSNCSLPGLVEATLERVDLPAVDAVVTSVGCGWRKPHDRAFEAMAGELGVSTGELVHVGDDPRTDGGGRTAGATVLLVEDVPLTEFPDWLRGR